MITTLAATRVILVRNYLSYRRSWWIFVTGFLEPVFFLLSIGLGVGRLITGFEVDGQHVSYAAFVAPGMLAASAMTGALLDSTMNVFFKLRYEKLYDQMLATPLAPQHIVVGEIAWCLIRSGLYSAAFLGIMAAMGLVTSWWALLALPAALLLGFAVAAVGFALTSFMRSWQDFEFVTLATLPMFLFSATFFPLSAYPGWLQGVVEVTPLYRGVVLCRELTTGHLGPDAVVSVLYLVAMAAAGLAVARRRLDALLVT